MNKAGKKGACSTGERRIKDTGNGIESVETYGSSRAKP